MEEHHAGRRLVDLQAARSAEADEPLFDVFGADAEFRIRFNDRLNALRDCTAKR